VPICRPLRWRDPTIELKHYSCRSFDLGLVHGSMPPALAALRDGVKGEEAAKLLFASRNKGCWPDDPKYQHHLRQGNRS
jgi:hypothetical protein